MTKLQNLICDMAPKLIWWQHSKTKFLYNLLSDKKYSERTTWHLNNWWDRKGAALCHLGIFSRQPLWLFNLLSKWKFEIIPLFLRKKSLAWAMLLAFLNQCQFQWLNKHQKVCVNPFCCCDTIVFSSLSAILMYIMK